MSTATSSVRLVSNTVRKQQSNLGQTTEDGHSTNTMEESCSYGTSDFQPSEASSNESDTLTEISTETPLNRSVATTETSATETDNESNIRSIDLSETMARRFDEGYDTDNEIGPFYQAVCDIDNNSVDDDNCYEWREGGNNAEEDLPTLEPAPIDDELESDMEEN